MKEMNDKEKFRIIEEDLRDRLREATGGLARIVKGSYLFSSDPKVEAMMTVVFLCQPSKKYMKTIVAKRG